MIQDENKHKTLQMEGFGAVRTLQERYPFLGISPLSA